MKKKVKPNNSTAGVLGFAFSLPRHAFKLAAALNQIRCQFQRIAVFSKLNERKEKAALGMPPYIGLI